MQEKSEYDNCPECGGNNIITDHLENRGEQVCGECGYVIGNLMDTGPQRAYTNEERKERSRSGSPVTYTLHDKGLSTVIDAQDKDWSGRRLSPQSRAQTYRLRKWQKRSRIGGATERNLAIAMGEITRISNALCAPKSVIENAAIIYRKAQKNQLIRGRSVEGVADASVYSACRMCGVPKTLDDIAKVSTIPKKVISRDYRHLVKELDMYESVDKQVPSNLLISKYSSDNIYQGLVQEIAMKTLKAAKDGKITPGKGPQGMSAAATYIATMLTGEKKTQKDIASESKVTEVTIRSRYRELRDKLMYSYSL